MIFNKLLLHWYNVMTFSILIYIYNYTPKNITPMHRRVPSLTPRQETCNWVSTLYVVSGVDRSLTTYLLHPWWVVEDTKWWCKVLWVQLHAFAGLYLSLSTELERWSWSPVPSLLPVYLLDQPHCLRGGQGCKWVQGFAGASTHNKTLHLFTTV